MDITRRRTLGRTGLELTQLGFGGAPIGNLFRALTDAEAHATVQAAWDAGVRYFDTAPLYGFGLSERRVGDALRAFPRDSYVLSTKVGCLDLPATPGEYSHPNWKDPLPFKPVYDYTYDGVMRSFEASLKRIGTYRIDLLYVHDIDPVTHGSPATADKHVADLFEGGGYKALVSLRDQGVIAGFGGGLNLWETCQRLAERGDFDAFLLAGRYTLLEQEALETFLPLCESRTIGVVLGGPYNSGILATGAVPGATWNYAPAPPAIMDKVARIEDVCRSHGVTLAQAALNFPLHHPQVATVIPGAATADEMIRNLATAAVDVPPVLWARLKAEGLMRDDAPTP